MPTYAVLGATGTTGQALMQVILQSSPDNHVNAYCRSASKLSHLCPEISNPANRGRVRIFAGDLNDSELLRSCLADTRSAFLAVAVRDNQPGCNVSLDTARAVVSAMQLQQQKTTQQDRKQLLPKLVVLSSASLAPEWSGDVPAAVHWVLDTAVSHLYADLVRAEAYLRRERDWLSCVFVKPGGLVRDRQSGHRLSTEGSNTPLSFLDLAAAMVEVADDDTGRYDMRNVGVLATADDVAFPWEGIYYVFTGLLFHFLPWTYAWLGDYRKG